MSARGSCSGGGGVSVGGPEFPLLATKYVGTDMSELGAPITNLNLILTNHLTRHGCLFSCCRHFPNLLEARAFRLFLPKATAAGLRLPAGLTHTNKGPQGQPEVGAPAEDASMWPAGTSCWSRGGGTQAAGSTRAEDPTDRRREEGAGPQSHRERRAQSPRGRKKKGAGPEAAERRGPNSRGPKEEGAGAPGGGGQARRPVGASPGRGAEGSGAPCCAAPGISVPGPRGRRIPHPQVTSDHGLSPRRRDTASARVAPPWLCSRDPSVPPGPSPRSPRLRSARPPSLFSRGRCCLSFPQPWSE